LKRLPGRKKMETKRGTITRVMTFRKYGFIRQEDGSDIFFHKCGVVKPSFDELREGTPVEFLITDSPKGTRAIGIVAV